VDQEAEAVLERQPALTRQDADRLFISPIARKLAKERGFDAATIPGSGPGGRIVRRDVESHQPGAAASTAVAPTAVAPTAVAALGAATTIQARETVSGETGGETGVKTEDTGVSVAAFVPGQPSTYTDTKHSPMRRAIARRLTESKSTVPHFYLTSDVRADRLLALRAEVNEGLGVKISVNDWVIKAVAVALIQVPEANVIWTDGALRHFDSADISVAVATEGGLYTPVVRGANRLGLAQISETVKDLAERSRSGTIRQEEIEGGSFAITNLGMFGTQEFSAILNPPQSGILAVGAASDRPVVDDGQLAVGKVMTVTLSCDHRAIDGALAAVFLARLQALLENPAGILAF
jgi:pyruvate dehydrogenase E2 component (dihydrolipoamide acetyltransferase)